MLTVRVRQVQDRSDDTEMRETANFEPLRPELC